MDVRTEQRVRLVLRESDLTSRMYLKWPEIFVVGALRPTAGPMTCKPARRCSG